MRYGRSFVLRPPFCSDLLSTETIRFVVVSSCVSSYTYVNPLRNTTQHYVLYLFGICSKRNKKEEKYSSSLRPRNIIPNRNIITHRQQWELNSKTSRGAASTGGHLCNNHRIILQCFSCVPVNYRIRRLNDKARQKWPFTTSDSNVILADRVPRSLGGFSNCCSHQ